MNIKFEDVKNCYLHALYKSDKAQSFDPHHLGWLLFTMLIWATVSRNHGCEQQALLHAYIFREKIFHWNFLFPPSSYRNIHRISQICDEKQEEILSFRILWYTGAFAAIKTKNKSLAINASIWYNRLAQQKIWHFLASENFSLSPPLAKWLHDFFYWILNPASIRFSDQAK